MKPDEINRAIAEACGWTSLSSRTIPMPGFNQVRVQYIGINPNGVGDVVPEYHGSLHSMHAALATLSAEEQREYVNLVMADTGTQSMWECLTLSASQQAIIFLRTKGLWKEEA